MSSNLLNTIISDRYRLEKMLGSGGTGSVYLCTDLKLDTKLAVKVLEKHKDTYIAARIEEKTLKLLNHRSLPQIVDVLADADYTYIIESYIEGTPLDKLLKAYYRFNENQVIEWAIHICEALSYLHALRPNPIIHRDIKPSNIIITKDNKAVLVDFGSCNRHMGSCIPDDIIMGTSLYSAPEQLIIGGISDCRTDIFCMGAMLYQLATGEAPDNEISFGITDAKYLSKGIRQIIGKCVEKERENRFKDVEELKSMLSEQLKLNLTARVNDERKLKVIPFVIGALSIITYLVVILGISI